MESVNEDAEDFKSNKPATLLTNHTTLRTANIEIQNITIQRHLITPTILPTCSCDKMLVAHNVNKNILYQQTS